MIYNEYRIKFYCDATTGKSLVLDYIESLNQKEQAKILKYIEFLRIHQGYLDEPYTKHLRGKIRELRVDFGRRRHRIFYALLPGRIIILLHAFVKKTSKTPDGEVSRAENNYHLVLNSPKFYE